MKAYIYWVEAVICCPDVSKLFEVKARGARKGKKSEGLGEHQRGVVSVRPF